jgi:hypothetical protein
MSGEAILIRDFPPFIRFELEDRFRRKIFAPFSKRAGTANVAILPEEFWSSAEEEFVVSRYELVFGTLRGRILQTLDKGPVSAKNLLKENPDLSPNSTYHALMWLRAHNHIKKRGVRWELIKGYFNRVQVSDLARILDRRHKDDRRRNALSIKELEMATFLWPYYKKACEDEGPLFHVYSYGRWYQNEFALARAVKNWAEGEINIPQWALLAIADFINVDIEESEVIASYSLPPGVKITPYYKGRYKLPIEVSTDLDLIALELLMTTNGLVHPAKHKKEIFKRLYHTFGTFNSCRIPLSIQTIIERYYHIPVWKRDAIRIPDKMKKRWELLPYHERTISKLLILKTLYKLDQPKRMYEIISRSNAFIEDVAALIKDLGLGDITIHKRKDRPHYRSYLPQKVKENLEELKKNVAQLKIEKGFDYLEEKEKIELIKRVKQNWGEHAITLLSNLTLDRGLRDLDLARACGVTPKAVRKTLYAFVDNEIITYRRDETADLVEYYYFFNPEGVKKFLAEEEKAEEEKAEEEKEEGLQYPFPEDFSYYRRRRMFSEVGEGF